MGNESRFVNHSCDPNLEVVRWKLADYDEYQIGLFALRDIAAKEELSYDYGWQAFSSVDTKAVSEAVSSAGQKEEPQKQLCLCAGPSCTGFFEKSEKVKEKKAALLNKTLKKSKVKVSCPHKLTSLYAEWLTFRDVAAEPEAQRVWQG